MEGPEQQREKSVVITAPIINYLKNGKLFLIFNSLKYNIMNLTAEGEELPRKSSQTFIIGSEEFSKFENQLISSSFEQGNGFVAVVSLHDANTLYVSSGISTVLGYPPDMLVGQVCVCNQFKFEKFKPFFPQPIMGFLYPKDRLTFANLLSRGLQSRFCHASETAIDSDGRFVFNVRIREYKGLKNCGFQVAGKKATCKPFQLRCFIRDVTSSERMNVPESCEEDKEQKCPIDLLSICFVIVAIPIQSAYKRKYSTRFLSFYMP